MTKYIPELETERLRLRPLVPDDAEAVFPSLSDPEVMRWWSRPPLESVATTRDYLARTDDDGWRAWAITRNDDDHAIGWVSVGEKREGVCEIGYFLIREAWGSGRAREAVTGILDHLFRSEEKRRVFADTDPDNAASRALLERLGFQKEGTLRGEWETHIGVRDGLIYGLLREEWVTGAV